MIIKKTIIVFMIALIVLTVAAYSEEFNPENPDNWDYSSADLYSNPENFKIVLQKGDYEKINWDLAIAQNQEVMLANADYSEIPEQAWSKIDKTKVPQSKIAEIPTEYVTSADIVSLVKIGNGGNLTVDQWKGEPNDLKRMENINLAKYPNALLAVEQIKSGGAFLGNLVTPGENFNLEISESARSQPNFELTLKEIDGKLVLHANGIPMGGKEHPIPLDKLNNVEVTAYDAGFNMAVIRTPLYVHLTGNPISIDIGEDKLVLQPDPRFIPGGEKGVQSQAFIGNNGIVILGPGAELQEGGADGNPTFSVRTEMESTVEDHPVILIKGKPGDRQVFEKPSNEDPYVLANTQVIYYDIEQTEDGKEKVIFYTYNIQQDKVDFKIGNLINSGNVEFKPMKYDPETGNFEVIGEGPEGKEGELFAGSSHKSKVVTYSDSEKMLGLHVGGSAGQTEPAREE